MERFYGFDLGDAESAISRLEKKENKEPEILTINEARSFITAYALLKDGRILIGEIRMRSSVRNASRAVSWWTRIRSRMFPVLPRVF